MVLKVARRSAVAPFYAMEVFRAANARAAGGAHILRLEVGEPAAGAPPAVIAAAQDALANEPLGYTEACGMRGLREAIAGHYEGTYGVRIPVDRIVVTTGASGAFMLAFLAAFDTGDRVALAEPSYPAYRNILSALGIEVVPLAATLADRFQPTPDMLAEAGPLDGLVIASPSNPAGTMLDRAALGALVEWCDSQGVRLISDEIYHGITYQADAVSVASLSESCVIANSFSKYFAMTGWRLGWMIVPTDLVDGVDRLAQNLFISPPTLPQRAALAAFSCRDVLDGYVEIYRRNRAVLLDALPRAGFDRLAPADGAFYIYADVSNLTDDAQVLCARMLDEIGVATTPGVDFDPRRGHRFMRISFAGHHDDIVAAAERILAWDV